MSTTKRAADKEKEDTVEKYLQRCIKGYGLCLKMPANLWRGIPDRLVVIFEGGPYRPRVAFAETKRPKGGKLSTAQRLWRKWLLDGGAEWVLLSTKEEVDAFLTEVMI